MQIYKYNYIFIELFINAKNKKIQRIAFRRWDYYERHFVLNKTIFASSLKMRKRAELSNSYVMMLIPPPHISYLIVSSIE